MWDQIANAVVVLLIGAAVAGFVVGEVIEAVAIVVVLVVNTVVGFVTELQAARSVASLRDMMRSVADVERDDRRDEIDATDLVPGDVVIVEAGERVPADIRLLDAQDLAADTGKAPLQEGLEHLSRRLAIVVVVGAAVLFGIGLLRVQEVTEVVEIAVALAIAVVPEGLPAVATLTLAIGMRRMAAGNALVRRLPAVETLGSTTVVCSDKTGTLTRNQMDVVEVELADGGDQQNLWVSAVLCKLHVQRSSGLRATNA